MDRFSFGPLSRLCTLAVCVIMGISAFGMLTRAYAFWENGQSSHMAAALQEKDTEEASVETLKPLSVPTDLPETTTAPVFAISCQTVSTPAAETHTPRVLIYHTHTYEAYLPDPQDPYPFSGGNDRRTEDETQNVVAVGARLAESLKALGVEVVHDTTAFEPPKFGTAYLRSLEMLKERLARGEDYDLIIDLHRDTYYAQMWTPAFAVVDGQESARVLFLIGNGEAGFTEKPNWTANKKRADAIATRLQEISPQLFVDVIIKDQRYNQHVSENAILIELGHCDNTLDSVLHGAEYLAQAIAQTLKGD